MPKHGCYYLLPDGRVARFESLYDGMPEWSIVCYVNWGGIVEYAKTAELLIYPCMTKKEYRKTLDKSKRV